MEHSTLYLFIYIVTVRCIKTLHTLYTGTGAPVACMRGIVSGGTVSLSVRRVVHRVATRVVAKIYRPLFVLNKALRISRPLAVYTLYGRGARSPGVG